MTVTLTDTTDGAPTHDAPTRLWRLVDAEAPPQRLAMLRILTGSFVVAYTVIRLPALLQLTERTSGFEGVGAAALLGDAVPDAVVVGVIVVTLVAGIAYILGWQFRWLGPMFAFGWLAIATYRSSWGQLLHFENLFVLHLFVIGFSPAADVWSIDSGRSRRRRRREPTSYGWPISLAALFVVVTYLVTGVAKLRYGGLDWILGDTLRNHVAYAAARLDLLGGDPSPLAPLGVSIGWVWPPIAATAVLIELLAPFALLGGRIRTAWVIGAWILHAGVLAFMFVAFAYPLLVVAFAPFFRVERLITTTRTLLPPSAQRALREEFRR